MRSLIIVFSFLFTTTSWSQSMNGTNAEKLKYFFDNLNKDNMNLVTEFYDPNVKFADPIGEIQGSENIKKYYGELYKNAELVKFDFEEMIESENKLVAVWKMTLKTDKLNGGEAYTVPGNSVLHFGPNGKAVYHRDYFDMGDFIYEKIPVVGFIVRKIKSRMATESKE